MPNIRAIADRVSQRMQLVFCRLPDRARERRDNFAVFRLQTSGQPVHVAMCQGAEWSLTNALKYWRSHKHLGFAASLDGELASVIKILSNTFNHCRAAHRQIHTQARGAGLACLAQGILQSHKRNRTKIDFHWKELPFVWNFSYRERLKIATHNYWVAINQLQRLMRGWSKAI